VIRVLATSPSGFGRAGCYTLLIAYDDIPPSARSVGSLPAHRM